MEIPVAIMCLALCWDSLVNTYWLNNFFVKEETFWDKKKIPSELGLVVSIQASMDGEFSFWSENQVKASSESDLQAMVVPAEAMKGTGCVGVQLGSRSTVCI